MNNYKAPSAQIVSFAAIDIIAVSVPPSDLNTWGEAVQNVSAKEVDLFK